MGSMITLIWFCVPSERTETVKYFLLVLWVGGNLGVFHSSNLVPWHLNLQHPRRNSEYPGMLEQGATIDWKKKTLITLELGCGITKDGSWSRRILRTDFLTEGLNKTLPIGGEVDLFKVGTSNWNECMKGWLMS